MIESTYYAKLDGKIINLPLTYKTIEQASMWLDKRTANEKAIRIFERNKVITDHGEINYIERDITAKCLDVLWNYYEQ